MDKGSVFARRSLPSSLNVRVFAFGLSLCVAFPAFSQVDEAAKREAFESASRNSSQAKRVLKRVKRSRKNKKVELRLKAVRLLGDAFLALEAFDEDAKVRALRSEIVADFESLLKEPTVREAIETKRREALSAIVDGAFPEALQAFRELRRLDPLDASLREMLIELTNRVGG